MYGWIGGLNLFLLVFLVPPFQVPDEPQHFFRGYQLSRGEVWPDRRGEITGGVVPASLPGLVERFLGTSAHHTDRVLTTQRLADTLVELERPLDAGNAVFAAFVGHPPLHYAPQALAIVAGRALDFGPLALLYAARLANALVAWALTCVALRMFRAGGRFALLVALLPMTQFMTASCSPDALTIAGALLFAALIARFLTDETWSRDRSLLLFASGTAMCLIKVVYVPLLLSGFAVLLAPGGVRKPQVRRALLAQAAACVLVLALVGSWLMLLRDPGIVRHPETAASSPDVVAGESKQTIDALQRVTRGPDGVNAVGQIAYLAQDPPKFLRIVARSFYFSGEFYWKSMVGYLGWLTLQLPAWVYWTAGIAFPLALLSESSRVQIPLAAAGWLIFVSVASLLLTELALYLTWTEVGGYRVLGVQGRYFIPLLPLLGFSLLRASQQLHRSASSATIYMGLVAVLIVVTSGTLISIILRYGLL